MISLTRRIHTTDFNASYNQCGALHTGEGPSYNSQSYIANKDRQIPRTDHRVGKGRSRKEG